MSQARDNHNNERIVDQPEDEELDNDEIQPPPLVRQNAVDVRRPDRVDPMEIDESEPMDIDSGNRRPTPGR